MARRGLSGLPIGPVLIILVGIIVILYILKNKNFLRFDSATAGIAIGESVPGPNVYPVVGNIAGDASVTVRSNGTSYRDNIGYDCSKCAREATWFFVPGGGDDVSVKLGSHEGGSSSLIEFSTDGQRWRCEGPHMTYGELSGSGNVPLGNSKVGIKGISWNVSGSEQHHEIWLNESGTGDSWTKVAEYTGGADGCNASACPVPGDSCQDTLRLDDPSGHQLISRSLVEITPTDTPTGGGPELPLVTTNCEDGGEDGLGCPAGGGGGTTPPPATTPPAEDEDEEEPEEEDSGDEDNGDDEDNGGDGDSPGTRSQDPTTRRINQCSGLTGETYRSCVNGAAARGNLARRPMYRAMLSAYTYPNRRFLRRGRIRIGNIG